MSVVAIAHSVRNLYHMRERLIAEPELAPYYYCRLATLRKLPERELRLIGAALLKREVNESVSHIL